VAITEERVPEAPEAPPERPVTGHRRVDLVVAVLSVIGAFWVTSGLWIGPNHRVIEVNLNDQALFEWFLAYAAHSVAHLHNPLWTSLLNTPDGVNLAVNTAVTVLGVALTPVTLLFGPPVAFAVALTANLAISGYAWYWLLSRKLGVWPVAAAVGGLFCGYAPGIVSHANAHLNFTAQFLVPVILARVLALRDGRPWRNGILLGLLLAVQYSLGAELLFFTALGCAVLLGTWVLAGHREPWRAVRSALAGLCVAAVVAVVLLAYPLWLQFFGRQTYHGTGFDQRVHSEDIAAYAAFPTRSLAGLAGVSTNLAPNPTEENSFFGVPLLVALVAAIALLIRYSNRQRRRQVIAFAGAAVVFAALSFGPVVNFRHVRHPAIGLPYAALEHLPLFDSALPARLALIVVPLVGALLALAVDALAARTGRLRIAGAVGIAAALLPLVPLPVRTMDRSPVPRFISAGTWRDYVQPGQTLMPVPPTVDVLPDGQRWQAAAMSTSDGATFRIPDGFFLGPGGPDGHGQIGPVPRPTYTLLKQVALTGRVPEITPAVQASAADDLRYWQVRVVVLPASGGTGNRWAANQGALLTVLTRLFGPGTRVDDVWLWIPPTP
jgi:hypothetical protein